MPDFSHASGEPEAKAKIRAALLATRGARGPEFRTAAAARVQAKLADLVRRIRPATVAAYVPVGGEPGGPDLAEVLGEVLAEVLGPHGRLLLPVLLPDLDLDWAAYAGPASLRPAGRGLREPSGPRLGLAAVGAAELVVVPALAVDRRGVRLGRGGGSYDRALSRVSARALVVALLDDGELLPALPAEPHDRPVDAVLTPSTGLLRLPLR